MCPGEHLRSITPTLSEYDDVQCIAVLDVIEETFEPLSSIDPSFDNSTVQKSFGKALYKHIYLTRIVQSQACYLTSKIFHPHLLAEKNI